LAKAIVEQAPIGCVFRTTEECADENDEDAVYGVSSIVPLSNTEVTLINLKITTFLEFPNWRVVGPTCEEVC
jgi:hypothetical protein